MMQTIDSSGLHNRENQTFVTKLCNSCLALSFANTIIAQAAANVKYTLHKIFKTILTALMCRKVRW